MKHRAAITALFALGALYDGVLGLVFLCAPGFAFRLFEVTPPNHDGYVQFPAALLLVFALMYGSIARDPRANRNLIPYGVLLKVCYCGVVVYHWVAGGIPGMWKPFAVIDAVFAVLFYWAYTRIESTSLHG